MKVYKSELISKLNEVGISKNSTIIVHSSLSSFGYVEGGARTVIDSLKEVVGPEGNILMPTFTYSKGVFNQGSSSLVGKITEVFRKDKDIIRSKHPTHSVAVFGKDKKRLVRNHFYKEPFGIGSPWWHIWKMEGSIVLIGVDNTKNSFIHFVERLLELPYKRTVNVMYKDSFGKITKRTISGYPGDSFGFNKLNNLFEEQGIVKSTKIGNSSVLVMNTVDVVECLSKILVNNPYYLLCDRDDCYRCENAKNMIREREYNVYA